MARIRTIKPEFFTSEDIVELPPLARLLYIALWCEADKEGRLVWKPRTFKMRYLPADDCDIDALCDALLTRRLLVLYGDGYAYIPTFGSHQHINPREKVSSLPDPADHEKVDYVSKIDASARVSDASRRDSDGECTRREERKGKEGKGKEGKGKEGKDVAPGSPTAGRDPGILVLDPSRSVQPARQKPSSPAPTTEIWNAYSAAYEKRYSVPPVRNAKVNGQLSQLLTRLGAEEAPAVAAWFVGHNNRYYVQKLHSVDCLLADAEKLRTEWATGRRVTARAATEADRLQETGDMWARIAAEQNTIEN